jgi:ComF family protein
MAGAPTALLGRLLGTLFPSRCVGCGLRGAEICDACRADLPWLTSEVCPLCSRPNRLARICYRCRSAPPVLDGARAACRFEGVVQQAAHDLKYKGVRGRASLLADLVAEALDRQPIAVDLLVPVPLAPGRRRERGFNQSELIARALGERLGVPVMPSALARIRETPRQVGRSGAERQENVAGAFGCPAPETVSGRRIALLDDVMTTGATLSSAAEPLKLAGASRVYGLAVAREV